MLDATYWETRYREEQTGWDLGTPSPPLRSIIESLTDRNLRILVPGAGNGHEVALLWSLGFRNVHLLDWAKAPLENFAHRVPDFPKDQLILGDFFEHEGAYDLVLEQTFFCAIDPSLREAYVQKMAKLIVPSGSLRGLLFSTPKPDGPPFGGTPAEYDRLFYTRFAFRSFVPSPNSDPRRSRPELLIHLIRRPH